MAVTLPKDKLCWKQVLSLSSANFSQAVMLTTPFTIGVFMVRDFEAAKHEGNAQVVDEQVVGRLTGLLAGIFSFSGFLTAYAWGCASNYIGRKPVIVIGTAVSYVSMLWFGLAGGYGTALAARAFGGFFNGILGAWKCMIGESTPVLLQGKFFGYMSLAWGLGCIAGPALGGAFARPCDGRLRLPLCGPGQLLRARPYFLACLVGSATLLVSLLLSILLLRETLPQPLRERGLAARVEAWRCRRRQARRQRRDETRPLRTYDTARGAEDGPVGAAAEAAAAGAAPAECSRCSLTGEEGAAEAEAKAAAESGRHCNSGGRDAARAQGQPPNGQEERARLLGRETEPSDRGVGNTMADGGAAPDRRCGPGCSCGAASKSRGRGCCGGGECGALQGLSIDDDASCPPQSQSQQPRDPPPQSPSMARMRGLFRLASRTFVGPANPFSRSRSWLRSQASERRGGGGQADQPDCRCRCTRVHGSVQQGRGGDVEDPWATHESDERDGVELCRSRSFGKAEKASADGGRAHGGPGGGGSGGGGGGGGARQAGAGSSTLGCESGAVSSGSRSRSGSSACLGTSASACVSASSGCSSAAGGTGCGSFGPLCSSHSGGCLAADRGSSNGWSDSGSDGAKAEDRAGVGHAGYAGTPRSGGSLPLSSSWLLERSSVGTLEGVSAGAALLQLAGGPGIEDDASPAAAPTASESTPLLGSGAVSATAAAAAPAPVAAIASGQAPVCNRTGSCGGDGRCGEGAVSPGGASNSRPCPEALAIVVDSDGGGEGGCPACIAASGDGGGGVSGREGECRACGCGDGDGDGDGGGCKRAAAAADAGGGGHKDVAMDAEEQPLLPWYRYPQVVLTILGYGITALIFCALDEVFPIFAAAPREAGGLGMREEQIAPPLMFFGAVLMPYSLYGYPPLQRVVGTLRLTRVGLVAAVAACLMIPLVASVRSGSYVGAMLVLYSAQVVKAFAQCSAFTGSIIAVNAAPDPQQLGAVNGVGQTLAALVRGVGPATGGLLWAASVGLHTGGQQFLTFAIIALVAAGNYLLYRFVRLPGMK